MHYHKQLIHKQLNIPYMFANLGKIDELAKVLSVKSSTYEVISRMIGQFSIGRMISSLSLEKKRGHDLAELLVSLVMFRIMGKTIGALSRVGFYNLLDMSKNSFYRILNRPEMDWRSLLLRMAHRFGAIVRKYDAEETSVHSCYIVDDTTIAKTGFHLEGLSRVFDHVLGKCVAGYKLLLLAYFDGRSTYAVDLSLHREQGRRKDFGLSKKERAEQCHKQRDENMPDALRYAELDKAKTDNAIAMIQRAWSHNIRAQYAVVDTWFVSGKFVGDLRKVGKGGVHLVGRMKMGNEKVTIGSRNYNVHQLISLHEREAKRCDKYKCLQFHVRAVMGGESVILFFVKVGRNENWNVIITTDMDMKFTEAFEIYQIRWNIEVIFKECRQYIGLGEYQGRDFDGQIADCTLCMMTHMLLTLGKRFSDYETTGGLFRQYREELLETTQWKRTLAIVKRLLLSLAQLIGIEIGSAMRAVIDNADTLNGLTALLSQANHGDAALVGSNLP